MERRVVITGLGAVTPLGNDMRSVWKALIEGRSGIGHVTKFDPSQFPSRVAGEVRGFDPLDFMSAKEARWADPFIQYALAASLMAAEDARFSLGPHGASHRVPESEAHRIGVLVG